MKQGVVIQRPGDLTVAWAQRVAERNTSGSVVVSAVKILSVDVGTTTRVRIAVEHNGPDTLPRRWFVKFPSLSWRARLITALPRLLQREVRFYNEVVQFVPVARPTMLAAQSTFGRGATLVLADVTELGGIPGLPGDLLTSAQAVKIVEQLAKLHARFWNKSSLEREYSWLGGPIQRSEKCLEKVLSVPLIKRGVRLAGSAIPSTLHASAIFYARQRIKAKRTFAAGPRILVHHDCHPGNIFWNRSESGLLDWQLVRIGEGIGDIAYFLATALSPKIRRAYEAAILERYIQVLQDHGVQALDPAALFQRYRAHLVYPFEAMVMTLAIGGMMALESNLELIRRTAAAVHDFDAFSINLV